MGVPASRMLVRRRSCGRCSPPLSFAGTIRRQWRHVNTPMLILHGERDYQVAVEEFGRWRAALGSRRDVTLRSYPALNHLFIAGTGASLPAEYQVPGHVAEEVIRDVASWIMTSR